MTAFTARASGNWSTAGDGAGNGTWTQVGVPGSGDSVNMGAHSVTVDVDVTVGDDTTGAIADGGSSTGTFTVAAGKTLTVNGWILIGKAMTLNAGSTISLSSSSSRRIRVGGLITVNGTSGSHVTIKTATASASNCNISATSSGQNRLSGSYLDLVDLGTSSLANTLGPCNIDHLTATGCGQLSFGANADLLAASNFSLTAFDITSPYSGTTNPLLIDNMTAPSGGATRTISDGRIDGSVIVGGVVTDLIVEKIVCYDSLRIGSTGVASGAFTRVKNILCASTDGNPRETYTYAPGPISRSVFSQKHTVHALDLVIQNAGTYEISECVFNPLVTSSGADSIGFENENASPPTTTVNIHNNLNTFGPDGTNSATLFNHYSQAKGLSIFCDHNTTAGECALSQGHGTLTDSAGLGILQSLQSNIYQGSSYLLQCYNPDRSARTTASFLDAWDKGTLTSDATSTTFTDSTAGWGTAFTLNPTSFWILFTNGPASGQATLITGNSSGTVGTVTAWSGATPVSGNAYLIFVGDPYDPADVGHNSFVNALATGKVHRFNGTDVSNIEGYDGHYIASGLPGANDLWDEDPEFVDETRNLATYDTAASGLNNAAATAWATATGYVVGDIRSNSDAGFYGNATINFRCITAHTSGASTEPGVGASWLANWEFATVHRLRLDRSLIDSLITWVLDGYAPTNALLQDAGHDSVTIGAVEGQFQTFNAAWARGSNSVLGVA